MVTVDSALGDLDQAIRSYELCKYNFKSVREELEDLERRLEYAHEHAWDSYDRLLHEVVDWKNSGKEGKARGQEVEAWSRAHDLAKSIEAMAMSPQQRDQLAKLKARLDAVDHLEQTWRKEEEEDRIASEEAEKRRRAEEFEKYKLEEKQKEEKERIKYEKRKSNGPLVLIWVIVFATVGGLYGHYAHDAIFFFAISFGVVPVIIWLWRLFK